MLGKDYCKERYLLKKDYKDTVETYKQLQFLVPKGGIFNKSKLKQRVRDID